MKHLKRRVRSALCIALCVALGVAGVAAFVFFGPEIRYQLNKKNYAQFEYIPDEDGNVGIQVQWEGRTYTNYDTPVNLYSLMGKQFGVIGGDPRAQMHAVEGLDTSEWVMLNMNILMGWTQLYKADDVTEIPEVLI